MKLYPANVLLSLLSLWATQLAGSLAQRTPHRFKLLSSQRVRSVMRCHDVESLFQNDLPAIAKPRVPGTPGHQEVQEYIVSRLQQLDCSRWNITEHSFEDHTPHGVESFTNIVATLDPEVDQRLVLAAHWDSKVLPPKNGKHFVGATDSALPVALLLDLALQLDQKLQERERTDYSLQLIFFDGEEAFVRWTDTDSLYGSRQLAADMSEEGGLLSVGEKTGIQAMEALILLDLIGSTKPNPSFYDMYSETTNLFQRLVGIEKRLKRAGHLEAHSMNYFKEPAAHYRYQIGDDHQPFLKKGVPVVHLITSPFPKVWHTLDDDLSAIDMNMVSNFKKIMTVFLHEYFHFG